MQWWGWIAGGVILLGAELLLVDAQFYLVFIGGSALLVGVLEVAGLVTQAWLQWLLFSLFAVVSLLGLRGRIYARLRGGALGEFRGGLVGESVEVPVALAAGKECRLEYRGSTWDAVNDGAALIAAGSSARIERVEGLKLYLRSS